MLSFILSIYILQSSGDKLARCEHIIYFVNYRSWINLNFVHCNQELLSETEIINIPRFVRETVEESSMPTGGVAKVE